VKGHIHQGHHDIFHFIKLFIELSILFPDRRYFETKEKLLHPIIDGLKFYTRGFFLN